MSCVAPGNTIFTPFKKFDWILNNRNELYSKKIESLIQVWGSISRYNLKSTDLQYIVQIIDWAKLHTLNIVLNGEWKKFKDQYQEDLTQAVKATQGELTKINNAFFARCQKLVEVISNPWNDPVLEYLLRSQDVEIGSKEIEFFCAETVYLTSVRLKKLCESHCEDLALNLVKSFMKCYKLSQTETFNLNATETQVWFIVDIYVALLFKFKENEVLLELLKGLSLEEGLNLMKRFAKKRVKISKIWKNCQKIAILASQVYISSAVLKPIEEAKDILKQLLQVYIGLNSSDAFLKDVMDSARSIIRLADTSVHIYVFCEVFQETVGLKLKAFIIELYIRALTTDMNNLERQKTDNDDEKVAETTRRLATGFCSLADILRDNVNVSRECVLTAFSLQPTEERLIKIQELAKQCGFEVLDTGQEWKCKLHPPVLASDELVWTCTACGDWMCKPQLNVPLNTNTALNEALTEEKLGITHELCDDLVVLLSSPRYQVFSWLLNWPDLNRLCIMYLQDPERTKNLVTDLKFVDIDYSMFASIKKEPVDDYYAGIERGYEQYLDQDFMSDDQISTISEDTASQESRPYSLGSDGTGEAGQYYLPTPQQKSDPNTLKSLRMFRPSLKRSRSNTRECAVPEKVFKNSDTFDFAIPSSSKYMQQPNPSNYIYPSASNQKYNSFQQPHPNQYNNINTNPYLSSLLAQNHLITKPTLMNYFDTKPPENINYSSKSDNIYPTTSTTPTEETTSKNVLAATLRPSVTQVALKDKQTTNSLPCKDSTTELPSCGLNLTTGHNNSELVKTDFHPSTPTTPSHKDAPNAQLPDPSSNTSTPMSKNPVDPNRTSSSPIKDETDCSTKKLEVLLTPPSALEAEKFDPSTDNTTDDLNVLLRNADKIDLVPKPDKKLIRLLLNEKTPETENQVLTRRSKNLTVKKSLSSESGDAKYESYPDTESDSQIEQDSDDQYTNLLQNTYSERKKSNKSVESNVGKKAKKSSRDDNDKTVSNSKCDLKPKTKGVANKELKVIMHRLNKAEMDSLAQNPIWIKKQCCKRVLSYLRHKSKKDWWSDEECRSLKSLKESNENENCKAPKKVQTKLESEKYAPKLMNPRVLLERLPMNNPEYARSVLANVPGLHDLRELRPANVNHIVNVVQISGGRQSSTVPTANSQTSTQVTPHIQRIGQPRIDKPEALSNAEVNATTISLTMTTSTATVLKPTTSQPSTFINILSPQIIRPGQSNCVRTRPSPLINILSQQIIRPATPQIITKTTSNSTQSVESQVNNNSVTKTVSSVVASEEVVSPAVSIKNTSTTTLKSVVGAPTAGQGTILQFICKSTLPKFQQAFGKTVYQNAETTDASTTTTENSVTTTVADAATKKIQTKNPTVNIQPIQGSVIYTRQMPVGQTINLIPPGRGQVFRIATSNSDQISLVKDTVIHSKMSALLAAALQGKKSTETQADVENNSEDSTPRVTVARPALVQNARIVKPVLQIPSNVIRSSPQTQTNMSSTTLEQLREFDMVYKQIKERSSTSIPAESTTQTENNDTSPQRISVTYLNQGQKYTQLSPVVVVSSSYCNLQPAASPALSVTSQGSSSPCVTPAPTPTLPKVSSKSSKGKTVKNTTAHATKSSPIPKPQQKPQEDEHTTQRIFDILAEYAEQLRNSPDLNNKPAPRRRSNPPTNPSHNSKRKKSSGSKKTGQTSSIISDADIDDQRTMGSEDSSCGVVQLSVKEEEQSQIHTTTTESNDSTNSSRQLILTDPSGNSQTRNLIIADSSVGEVLKSPNTAVLLPGNYIMPVSMVKGGQQIAVVSGGSKILATVPTRSGPNMLLFQSFLNQNRKPGVPTVKYSTTIQPLSGISSQSLAGVSAQPPVILPSNSHGLTAVTLGQPLTIKKMEDSERINTELLLTIAPPKENMASISEANPQPDSSTNVLTSNIGNIKLEETLQSEEKVFPNFQKTLIATPIATPVIAQTACIKEESVEEEVETKPNIITLNISPNAAIKDEAPKATERVQSVLVTTCSANGPMLSHTPPRYRKPLEIGNANSEVSIKEEFMPNGGKVNYSNNLQMAVSNVVRFQSNNNESKHFQSTVTYFPNKNKKVVNPRLDRELHQLCLQRKQAALERELRLQKSLSEECEDLGVDEPSTSDLFPEADLLFDSNHSPSFDQSSQDIVKRVPSQEKEESKPITLFSDDDNSSSLRTDFLFEPVEYQTETELQYEQTQQLTNGQSSTSNESGSSCEDNTILQNCASMSDVTLNSPLSPEYVDNTPPTLNKYKFKYSNRKKGERPKQNESWTAEVSSSEDTTGSTELRKSHSPEPCKNKRGHSIICDEELSDGSYKVVRVAISKTDLIKDDESCEELLCEEDLDSPSGRGARRSVKKLCSCCNGAQDGTSRKRPSSRPQTPASHKKAFLNKKR